MTNLLETMKTETITLNNVTHELQDCAKAFAVTGNESMASTLYDLAYRIKESKGHMQDAVKIALDEAYAQAQQSSANVLNAALAGAELQKRQG